jgi:Agrobacterium tumefaciens protein Atu4866
MKYWDDSGFAAPDDFVEPDVLHHAGKIFYRR